MHKMMNMTPENALLSGLSNDTVENIKRKLSKYQSTNVAHKLDEVHRFLTVGINTTITSSEKVNMDKAMIENLKCQIESKFN